MEKKVDIVNGIWDVTFLFKMVCVVLGKSGLQWKLCLGAEHLSFIGADCKLKCFS